MLERAHVVQAVGEFDEHDADVVDHGEHHLAQILGLRFFPRREIDLADLGDAFDDVRDLLAKFLADFDAGDGRVFDRVVQQAGGDGDRVHAHIRENVGDFEGMDQIGLAGRAMLAGVVLLRKLIGALDEIEIVVGTVLAQLPHQLAESRYREHAGRDLVPQRRHDGFYRRAGLFHRRVRQRKAFAK